MVAELEYNCGGGSSGGSKDGGSGDSEVQIKEL